MSRPRPHISHIGMSPRAPGIRISAICPGFVDTDMIGRLFDDPDAKAAVVRDQEPIGRMGTPDEIAAAVLWLCAEETAFTIGHALVVDGGQTV